MGGQRDRGFEGGRVPEVATIIACAAPASIAPCSISITIKSSGV
jgi:hypothetical protein